MTDQHQHRVIHLSNFFDILVYDLRTWSLDVADDRTRSVVHELDTDLGDTTTGAYAGGQRQKPVKKKIILQ